MNLSKDQADIIDDISKSMCLIHKKEKEEDDPYMADSIDNLVSEVEDLLFSLGKINKKIF